MFSFLYQFLFIDQKTQTISHTKLWSNIGYAVMCFTFPYAVVYGTTADYMLWVLFGVVVIGNRSIIKVLTKD